MVYFQAVARAENITKAAQQLHIPQPSLSRTISKLEEDLGVPLFERQANTLRLNDCGRAFLKRVDHILLEIQEARDEVKEWGAGECGNIYFAATVPGILNDLIREYLKSHPRVRIHQVQATVEQMSNMLLNREIDFALSTLPIISPKITWTQLIMEKRGIVVSKRNPLSSRKILHFDDFKFEPLILNSNVDQLRIFQPFFESEGLSPNVFFEGDQPEVIGHLISNDYGIGFSTKRRFEELEKLKKNRNDNDEGLVFCDIKPDMYSIVGVSVLKDYYMSPATRDFYQYLIKNIS